MSTNRKLCVGLLSLALILTLFGFKVRNAIQMNSQTFDEANHLVAGYSYITTGDFRLNPEHPPITKVISATAVRFFTTAIFSPDPELWEQAESWQLGRDFVFDQRESGQALLAAGRAANAVLGGLLVGLVGWWGYRVSGYPVGLAAMAIAAFDPNLIAHSALITADVGLTLFHCLTIYLCWEYLGQRRVTLVLVMGISLGLALATKFTSLLTAAILFVVLSMDALLTSAPKRKESITECLTVLRRVAIVALLCVIAVYAVHGFPQWVVGIRAQFSREATPAYLAGEVRIGGWLHYFALAFLWKTPVILQVLMVVGLCRLAGSATFSKRDALCLVLPPTSFLLAIALTRTNLGIRYLLPLYPFVWLWAAQCVRPVECRRHWQSRSVQACVWLLIAMNAACTWRSSPNFLSYFNTLAGGPDQGAMRLSDSNVDWGQGLIQLRQYLAEEHVDVIYLSYFGTAPPGEYGIRYQYVPGFADSLQRSDNSILPLDIDRELLAVSVTNLHGQFLKDPKSFHWLSDRVPIAKVAHCIYVFDITNDIESHRRLAELYLSEEMSLQYEREQHRLTELRRHQWSATDYSSR